jgi:hypothetical protein
MATYATQSFTARVINKRNVGKGSMKCYDIFKHKQLKTNDLENGALEAFQTSKIRGISSFSSSSSSSSSKYNNCFKTFPC